MSRFMEAQDLAAKVVATDSMDGADELANLLLRRGDELLAVTAPAPAPLDLPTWRVRHSRASLQDGPRWRGGDLLMQLLEDSDLVLRATMVADDATRYVVLLDEDGSEVLAILVIDPPLAGLPADDLET